MKMKIVSRLIPIEGEQFSRGKSMFNSQIIN
jgi:hypothetical protein